MKYVLDTNVISEAINKQPNPQVRQVTEGGHCPPHRFQHIKYSYSRTIKAVDRSVRSPMPNRIHTTVVGFVSTIQSRFYRSRLNKNRPPH
jgi:hypothetical protein